MPDLTLTLTCSSSDGFSLMTSSVFIVLDLNGCIVCELILLALVIVLTLQCFDTVGSAAGRTSGL